MEDRSLFYLRRRHTSHEGVTVNLAMEIDFLVEDQESLVDEGRPCECVQVETSVVLPLWGGGGVCNEGYATGRVGGKRGGPACKARDDSCPLLNGKAAHKNTC